MSDHSNSMTIGCVPSAAVAVSCTVSGRGVKKAKKSWKKCKKEERNFGGSAPGGVCSWGESDLGGLLWGGVCPRGCLLQGRCLLWGVSAPRGWGVSALKGVSASGGKSS